MREIQAILIEGAIIYHSAAIKNNSLEAIYYQHRVLIRSKIGDLNGAVSDFKSVFNFGNENEIFLSITYLIDVYLIFTRYLAYIYLISTRYLLDILLIFGRYLFDIYLIFI